MGEGDAKVREICHVHTAWRVSLTRSFEALPRQRVKHILSRHHRGKLAVEAS